jgi:hypothetical protein
MRTFKVWTIVALCVAAYAATPTAGAQQRAEDIPPPRTERLEEGDAPTAPPHSAESNRSITEKREQGKVILTEVKSGNSTYYLKPNAPAGSALPGDAQSNALRAAQWKVLEFDWNRGSEAKKTAESTAQVPPPPSPTPTSPTEKK